MSAEAAAGPLRLSVVIEWANARLNGEDHAPRLLERFAAQWQDIQARRFPPGLPAEARRFLEELAPRAELLLVSPVALRPGLADDLSRAVPRSIDVALHVAPGLEYYPLKNFGAGLAGGDLLLFVDCDVLPDDGWLPSLLGSFARPEVQVVCAQTYVAPADLWSRAFALGWNYDLRDPAAGLGTPAKFYANTMAFRTPVFRKTGFRPLGRRSRGAASMLRDDLARLGIAVWENRAAGVAHPPPSGLGHLVVRALAEGRDHYLKHAEHRSGRGLRESLGIAGGRLVRGFRRARRHWRRVGLRRWEVAAALAIISTYYGTVAVGGALTHVSPAFMARRFRV